MDGYVLRCNNLRCRETLHTRALVTTCSHVFCPPCADSYNLTIAPGNHIRRCPACDSQLPGPEDAVFQNLNPGEEYKGVLCGLAPVAMMEIVQRGLAFWGYQVTQEVIFQEHCMREMLEKFNAQSAQMDGVVHEANTEINRLKERVETLERGEQEWRRRNAELAEGFRDKGRRLAQVQELYDKLKRRTLISQIPEAASASVDQQIQQQHQQRVENLQHASGGSGGFPITAPTPVPSISGFSDRDRNQRNPNPAAGGFINLTGPDIPPQVMSVRRTSAQRHGGMAEADFLMQGARVGNVHGGGEGGRLRTRGSGSGGGPSPILGNVQMRSVSGGGRNGVGGAGAFTVPMGSQNSGFSAGGFPATSQRAVASTPVGGMRSGGGGGPVGNGGRGVGVGGGSGAFSRDSNQVMESMRLNNIGGGGMGMGMGMGVRR